MNLRDHIRWSLCAAAMATACIDTAPVDLGDAVGDASNGDTTADTNTRCVAVTPTHLAFEARLGEGRTLQANVVNCGTDAIDIASLAFAPGAAAAFDLHLASVVPTILEAGATFTLSVAYVPTAVSLLDGDGAPIPDTADVVVETSADTLHIPVSGVASGAACPTAVITASEGEEVFVQTKLHLDGSQSRANSGEIADYRWSVEQPSGAASEFFPSPSAASPTFQADVVGRYTFRLTVYDQLGIASCAPAEYTVYVNGSDGLHIELSWSTPSDPDPTDGQGADLDMHFMHPNATGYFDPYWDVFWFNEQPDWGAVGDDHDNPVLERDDTAAIGPENLAFDLPENGTRYCLSVNYWDDAGFGESYATVRIYRFGNLRFEKSDVRLVDDDMWDVTCFTWPMETTEFEDLRNDVGDLRITHDYANPLFASP